MLKANPREKSSIGSLGALALTAGVLGSATSPVQAAMVERYNGLGDINNIAEINANTQGNGAVPAGWGGVSFSYSAPALTFSVGPEGALFGDLFVLGTSGNGTHITSHSASLRLNIFKETPTQTLEDLVTASPTVGNFGSYATTYSLVSPDPVSTNSLNRPNYLLDVDPVGPVLPFPEGNYALSVIDFQPATGVILFAIPFSDRVLSNQGFSIDNVSPYSSLTTYPTSNGGDDLGVSFTTTNLPEPVGALTFGAAALTGAVLPRRRR